MALRRRGYPITPLAISGTPITSATQNSAYTGFSVSASGGYGGYVYSVSSGTLPTGISLNSSTGVVSGTPTGTGTSSNIVITVTDARSNTASLAAFSITVSASGNSIIITDATGGNSNYSTQIPTYRDAYIVMSPTVAQGDEAIDLQQVVGTAYSPTATTITLTDTGAGSHLQYFDKAAGGKLIFKAATRASVPRDGWLALNCATSNANGAGEDCTINIWVPATADEVFVSFANGSDTSPGDGSITHPYKHCPGTADWTGSATTYTTGKTIIFEGTLGTGAPHETSLYKSTSLYPAPDHHGTSSKQHRYAFYGWKGQAKFTGAKSITNSWASASNSDTYSNPSTASCEKVTIGITTGQRWMPVAFGDTLGWIAQYPRPNDLTRHEDWQAAAGGTNNYNDTTGTSDGGMKGLKLTSSTSEPTAVHLYSPTGTATSHPGWVQDAKLDARFNNASVGPNANGIGVWIQVPMPGNNIAIYPITQYDVTLHRAYFDTGSYGNANFGTIGSNTAYALLGSPYDVQVSTQYAYDTTGATIVAYRPNTDQARISVLNMGGGIGQQPYVSYHQSWFERYSGGSRRNGTTVEGGTSLYAYAASGQPGIEVFGLRAHQNYSEAEDPVTFRGYSGSFTQFIFHRFQSSECARGGGTKSVCDMTGITTGTGPNGYPTLAEVLANPKGKVKWCYFTAGSASRSLFYWTKLRGVEFYENVISDFDTVHGDGYPWYRDITGSGGYNDHNVIRCDLADNVCRWHSTSDSDTNVDLSVAKSNWFIQNVVLARNQTSNTGIMLFDGDSGCIYDANIMLRSTKDTANTTSPCFNGGGGFANMTVQNCILNGATMSTSPSGSVPATWSFLNNGLTANSLPTNDAGNSRIQTGTTTLTTAQSWDMTTIPSAWQTILLAGASPGTKKIGPFWKI